MTKISCDNFVCPVCRNKYTYFMYESEDSNSAFNHIDESDIVNMKIYCSVCGTNWSRAYKFDRIDSESIANDTLSFIISVETADEIIRTTNLSLQNAMKNALILSRLCSVRRTVVFFDNGGDSFYAAFTNGAIRESPDFVKN